MPKLKQVTWAESQSAYWAGQTFDVDATLTSSAADLLGANRVTMKFTRAVPAGLREDVCLTSLWVAKTAGGGLFSMIPVSEIAALETALDTFLAVWRGIADDQFTCTEYAWHQVNEATPRDASGKGQKMGPAVRVTPKTLVGNFAGTRLPDQVALNTTLRTASRKHWGRSYWPGLSAGDLQVDYGRYTNAVVDAVANGLNALHDTWQTAGYQLGVWSMLHPAFLTPKAIEVDDIPDIQRRRRPKQPGYRKIV